MKFREGWCVLLLLAMYGCGGPVESFVDLPVEDSRSAQNVYESGLGYLREGKYAKASEEFEILERQYGYSDLATTSALLGVYANYKRDAYERAILGARRFIALNPNDSSTPYARYLLAMAHYVQIPEVTRDQRLSREALSLFREVLRRDAGTDYARDAAVKLDLALDHLSGREMEVGRYYLGKGEPLGAIGRFQRVVEEYGTTSQAPEALYRLVESWLWLGRSDQARRAAAVLGHNFPGSEWYERAFELMGSRGLLTGEEYEAGGLSPPLGEGGEERTASREVLEGRPEGAIGR